MGDDVGQRRLGDEHQPIDQGTEALRPEPHLFDRLLARHVQDRAPGAGPGGQHLEDQGRLADARFAAEQRDAARDQPAAEDAIELVDPGGDRAGVGRRQLVIGTGCVAGASDGVCSTGASSSSASVFQSSHPGQRPAHLGAAPPQLEHRKTVRARVTSEP